MSTQNNNIKLTLETKNSVVLSNDPVSIIVDQRDWNRLKRAVDKYKSMNDWWFNIGFASFGIAGSAFITAFSLSDETSLAQTKLVLWLVGAFGALLGVTCCIAHKNTKSISTTSIEDIRTAIRDIEDNIKQDEHDPS